MTEKIVKSDAEWRALLTPMQYNVTRRRGTEHAYGGAFHDHKEKGRYCCICCGNALFGSEAKYDSGTGWPSFRAPLREDAIRTERDNAWFLSRTEVLCAACDAHLGHVFDDGPAPAGLRYCINSASLRFEQQD